MGKTIKIYLANESAAGIRHVEITNWSGQALACPRSRFQELGAWDELRRPGVYFLFGVDDQTGNETAYIGEAEVVLDRLAAQMSGKDFWSEVVAFTSKDENLTKGHVRYLESRLVTMTKVANRYRLTNGSSPQLPSLPRSDRDAMEDFISSIQMLLGVLGHKILDPLVIVSRAQVHYEVLDPAAPLSRSSAEALFAERNCADLPAFSLRVSGLTAYAIRTDEGVVVLADSQVASKPKPSLTGGLLATRDFLFESGVIVQDGLTHRFLKNHLFRSPSQAAAVVVGYSINGRENWRLPDGTSWGAYEARSAFGGELSESPC